MATYTVTAAGKWMVMIPARDKDTDHCPAEKQLQLSQLSWERPLG